MPRPFVHIAANGLEFNNWLVIDDSRAVWQLRCRCGHESEVRRDHVMTGKSKSCMSCAQRRHGMEGTPVYFVWAGMKQRCQNRNYHSWETYGGRGITVCERWQKFENFLADMGEPPKGASIDRIDNNGNYEPSNCRWATPKAQQRNRRVTRMLTFEGKKQPLAELAERFGIQRRTLVARIRTGWTVEDALTRPVRQIG